MYEVLEYVTANGKKPFAVWFLGLKDKRAQAKIRVRLRRVGLGNFGDCKHLVNANGICEMREHWGGGYRIYYKQVGQRIVLLLAGSIKADQNKTIEKAIEYLKDYERRTI